MESEVLSKQVVQNNVTEIRADALKLLAMLKRPVPRAAATIGAWLNIFQVFIHFFGLREILSSVSFGYVTSF